MKETENSLVLSFTNKAIENVKARLTNNHYEKRNANKIYFTFDRLMIDKKRLLSITGMCALVQPVKSSKHDSNGTCQTKIARFTNIKTRIQKSNWLLPLHHPIKRVLKKLNMLTLKNILKNTEKKPLNVRCNPIKLVKYNVKIEDEKKNWKKE